MNEKEATEIKKVEQTRCTCDGFHPRDKNCPLGIKVEELEIKYTTHWHILLHTATGYLEAIEKADDLLETLKLFVGYDCQCFNKKKCDVCMVLESIAKWEKEK